VIDVGLNMVTKHVIICFNLLLKHNVPYCQCKTSSKTSKLKKKLIEFQKKP